MFEGSHMVDHSFIVEWSYGRVVEYSRVHGYIWSGDRMVNRSYGLVVVYGRMVLRSLRTFNTTEATLKLEL